MPQLTFNFTANTHRSHPLSSYKAAERVKLKKACSDALDVFKAHNGLTRKELADRIGYREAEKVCKRAKDLEVLGLITRTPCPECGEIRNFVKEIG